LSFKAFEDSFRIIEIFHIFVDTTREVISIITKEKITRLVYNYGTHPTRTIDGSAGIMGVSGAFLRNFGALGGT
jgi:hypothetical protein